MAPGSKVGRPDSDGCVTVLHLIGMLCLAGSEDGILPKSTQSLFELARIGGFRGTGGAGFRLISEFKSEGGGKDVGGLVVFPCCKARVCALSWIRLEIGLCFTLDWRGSVPICSTMGFVSKDLRLLSASAVVRCDTTTQSGSSLGLKGFDGLLGFGIASLDGASRVDRAARPVSPYLIL